MKVLFVFDYLAIKHLWYRLNITNIFDKKCHHQSSSSRTSVFWNEKYLLKSFAWGLIMSDQMHVFQNILFSFWGLWSSVKQSDLNWLLIVITCLQNLQGEWKNKIYLNTIFLFAGLYLFKVSNGITRIICESAQI